MPPEEEYSRRSERGTVMNILQQVLRLIDNPLTDDQERISFTRHKLSFLLHWLKMQDPDVQETLHPANFPDAQPTDNKAGG